MTLNWPFMLVNSLLLVNLKPRSIHSDVKGLLPVVINTLWQLLLPMVAQAVIRFKGD